MRKGFALAGVALALGLAGCGGGGGTGASSTPPPTNFAQGNFTGRAAGTNPPVTTSALATVATGMTGVFTQLKLRDQSVNLSDTRLAISSSRLGLSDMFTTNIDGSNVTQLTNTPTLFEGSLEWNQAGNKIAVMGTRANGTSDIYIYRNDGILLDHIVNASGITDQAPSWSPDGTKLLLSRADLVKATRFLVIYDTVTKTITPIPTGTGDAYGADWSSTNRIVFVTSRDGGGTEHLYTVNPDGLGLAPFDIAEPDLFDPRWSPNGQRVYMVSNLSSTFVLERGDITLTGSLAVQDIYTFFNPPAARPAPSPDGLQVAVLDFGGTKVVEIPASGDPSSVLFHDGSGMLGLDWGPIIRDRLLVGTGGLLSTTASGFIYADDAARTESTLVFSCVTPSSAILRAMTGIGGSEDSLVFSLDADSVNSLSYANAPAWNTVSVILGSAQAANGAVISIGATNGQVNAVLPFVGSRAVGSRPTVTRSGSSYVFSGQFVGAFDGSGKNVAPSGASTVRLDPKTGVLTAS